MPDGAVPLSSTRRPRPPIAVPTYLTPTSIAAVRELAELMAAGEWAPASYRGADGRYVVEKIVLGIMHGAAVGLGPFAAVHAIAAIDGQPTIWGDGALALVERSGLLEDMSEDYLVDDDEGLTAVCTMRRHPWPTPVIRRFSMAMAEAAGLTQKEGPWQTYPRRMLTMRARSWALRDGFADVLRGLSIREEVDDCDPVVAASPRPEFANRSVAPFRQPIARPRFADYLSARSTAGPQARCRGGLCVDHGHAENAAAIADIISPNVIGAAETSARSMDPAPLGGANKLPAPADEGRTRENLSGATDGVAACPTDKQKDTGIEPLKVWPNADAAVADDLSVSAAYALVDADGNFIEVGTLAALPEAFDRLITDPHLSAAQVLGLWESNALARDEIEKAFGVTALADADRRRQSAEREKVNGAAEQRSSRAIASIQIRRSKTRNAATAKLEFDPACGNEELFQLYRSRLLRLKRRRAKAAAFTDFRHANSASETRLREQVPDRMAEIDALYRWAAAHAS
jgi:hypothetical protein